MRKVLVLLIVALVSFSLGPIWPRRPTVGGGGNQVVMMTIGVSGEYNPNARTPIADGGAVEYKYPFGAGNAGSEATETTDEAFAIVPIDGEFRAIRLYNDYGELDATEDIQATLRECPNGDLASCTWTDTAATVTLEGESGTGDTTATTSGLSVSVTAGDVFTMALQHAGPTGASVYAGSQETANYLLEFVSDNDDESFMSSTMNKSGPGTYFPVTGALDTDFGSAGPATMTMPGSFTLTALRGSRTTTANTRTVYLCDAAGTGVANCGSAGAQLAACTFSSGSDNCSSTGLSVSLTTDSDLFYKYSNDFEAVALTVGMALESSNQEWVSGSCHGTNTMTNDSTESGFGAVNSSASVFGYYCNATNSERGCETRVITESVAKHMVGYTDSSPAGAGDEFNVLVAEGSDGGSGATDSALTCDMGNGDTACTGTTDVTIEAGNTFLYRFTSVGTSDATNGCWSTLWDSL